MVALSKSTDLDTKTPLRVRAQNHRYRSGVSHCSKSSKETNLRAATYDEFNRLESCSKDPIGFVGGLNLYSAGFVSGDVDPSGMCRGKFTLITDPSDAPMSVPVVDRDLMIDLFTQPVGYTQKCFDVLCTCSKCEVEEECCGESFRVDCTVTIAFQILIDSGKIAEIAASGIAITPEGVYGHEQRHVQNYVREMNGYLGDIDNFGKSGCLSKTECATRSLQLQSQIGAKFREFELQNRSHSYPEPEGGLTPYPPLSPMPRSPVSPVPRGECELSDCLEKDWQQAVRRAKGLPDDPEPLF